MQVEVNESPSRFPVLSPQGLTPGTQVGRWRVERRVGGGGNGTVYEARLKPRGRSYALKVAHVPDDARFTREANALALVRHPSVVRLVEAGLWQAGPVRYPYLILEYVRGEALYDWALARNPTARQVAGLLRQVAEALAEAHRRGVLHRDFKGENTRVGEDGRLVVLDWGSGWHPGAAPLTATARLPPGTPPYHSPQATLWSVRAARGPSGRHYRYTVADELYAVGVTFYRLLVEQYPPLQLGMMPDVGLHEPGPWAVRSLNPRVPEALAAWVQRLLAFEPEARPESAEALATSVQRELAKAGPAWDEPLFEWYAGPAWDTRTTSEGAPQGPVAPGQELALLHARMQRMDRVLQHREARWTRRRELARVVTLPDPAGAASWMRSPASRPWRLALAAGALVTVAGVAWVVASWSSSVPAAAPEIAPGGRQLAHPTRQTDTATPTAALPVLPIAPPWTGDAMPTTAQPLFCPTLLQRYLLAASVAASLSACAARQARPEPARCPPEALEAMRGLHLDVGNNGESILDITKPDDPRKTNYYVPVNDGPVTSLLEEPFGGLPKGTLIYGRLWTGGKEVIAHFNRVRTPDGREYPVCFITEALKERGSQPGYTLVRPTTWVTVVDRFFSNQEPE